MNKQNKQMLDDEDIKIERGELSPIEERSMYPNGVLTALRILFKSKRFPRPRGKMSPIFSFDEFQDIACLIFFKPPGIVIKKYERTPKEREITFKRRWFIAYYFGKANFNGALAARMAGYSHRSAKQIAYYLRHPERW